MRTDVLLRLKYDGLLSPRGLGTSPTNTWTLGRNGDGRVQSELSRLICKVEIRRASPIMMVSFICGI